MPKPSNTGRLCLCGCGTEVRKGKIWRQGHFKRSTELRLRYSRLMMGRMKKGLERVTPPSLIEIAWAAGIYEGEGSCLRAKKLGGGCQAQVSQKDGEITLRLRDLFGGSVCTGRLRSWHVSGARARGFLLTIYRFMSERRKRQIEHALSSENTTPSYDKAI
jgi:hypothetical protein